MASHDKNISTDQRKTPLCIERRFDQFGDWLDTSWAAKVVSPVLDRHPHSILVITWLMRLLVGATFTVSGLAKAIDPWGTYYKMQDYLDALHIPLEEWGNTVVVLGFFLFSLEFFIGVSLLLGCFRKAVPILAMLVMMVMLPLTLWIAMADPVADCGCFGDFLVISNWTTFVKNVLLSVAVVWLLKFNGHAVCLINPYLQWMAVVSVAAYILMVGYVGYRQQPMIDFRQYKVGTRLLNYNDDYAQFRPVYEFIYSKDGEEKTFGEDDELPDAADGWTFVRREEKEFVEDERGGNSEAFESDFRIWNEDATEDVTESVADNEDQLILFIPDIKTLSMADSWKINAIYDMAVSNGQGFFAVASGDPADIEQWSDLSSGQYPVYTAEDTSIKELVRGNPGLVYLQGGIINWKTALSSIILYDPADDIDNVNNIENDGIEYSIHTLKTYPIGIGMSGPQALTCLSIILIGFLAILAFIPYLRR